MCAGPHTMLPMLHLPLHRPAPSTYSLELLGTVCAPPHNADLRCAVCLLPSARLQTKSVRDLARLSLDEPEYLAVHSEAAAPTPLKLRQAYMVVSLGQKMDVLWGFIKSHLTSKTIVFLSTCKQVRARAAVWQCAA